MAHATIRATRTHEGDVLREIERRAGERFHDVGLHGIADDEPMPVESLAAYARAGRSWVAVDPDDEPLAYVIVDVVDGQAHIEQISVQSDHQGTGLGRALIAHVRDWASERGMKAITLTTFVDVPWNRPLYEHLGFVVMGDHQIGPELRALQKNETLHGLDPTQRICMRLDLEG
jgi:GNAT superfamily N-acetyltransferase